MKALKGLLKYMGIVILAIILIFAAAVGIMYLTGVNLFGYYFVDVDKNDENAILGNQQYISIPNGATTMEFNIIANNYDICIYPGITDGSTSKYFVTLTSYNHYFGFLKGTKVTEGNKEKMTKVLYPNMILTESTLNATSNGGKAIINIAMKEPEGLLKFEKNNCLYIMVPWKTGVDEDNQIKFNFNITTGNGDIILKNSVEDGEFKYPLNVNSLKITTNKGNATFEGFGNKEGEINKTLNAENLNINTNGGEFDFTGFDNVNVTNEVKLVSKNATYKFKNLIAPKGVTINGNNIKFSADKVVCGKEKGESATISGKGFDYKSTTGTLNIGVLSGGNYNADYTNNTPYENTIITESAVVNINTLVGKLGLVNEYGDVNIGLITHQASIRTENGDINIGKSGYFPTRNDGVYSNNVTDKTFTPTSSLVIYSTYGNINLGEYYQSAMIRNLNGKITAHSYYHDEPPTDNPTDDDYYYSNIQSKNGAVDFITEKNPFYILATDNATISVIVKDMVDQLQNNHFKIADNQYAMYFAKSEGGTINAQLPIKSYWLRTSGNVNGGVGSAVTEYSEDGVSINGGANTNANVYLKAKKINLSTPY